MLSIAAFLEGRHAQAFPSFGSERTGAPVVAYCRIDDKDIRLREPIANPDALIIQDPTLLLQVDVFAGLKAEGYILINTSHSYERLGIADVVAGWDKSRLCNVPATELAIKHVGRPVPNVPLLGAFSAISGMFSLASVVKAIREKFSGAIAEGNIAAAAEAFALASRARKETAHAEAM